MEGPWLVSYLILWLVVLALGLVALAHSRLLGVMYQRIGPAPARPLDDVFPPMIAEIYGVTLLDQPWKRTFPSTLPLLAIYVSPQCQSCNELMPHVKDFAKEHGDRIEVILLSVLRDFTMNQAYARFARLDQIPYIIADRFSEKFPVPVTPYAIMVDGAGQVVSKGVVNNFEHLVDLARSVEGNHDHGDMATSV